MKKAAPFMDFELGTENVTFYPRPETEILVEKAIELLSRHRKVNTPCNILDIGTGSGNIAISLTKYVPSSRMVALDISDTVLRIASRNAAKYGVEKRIEFIRSDLFKNLKTKYRCFFDLIISNPPYISRDEFSLLPAVVKNDPRIALYGGRDGLDFYRRISREAGNYLKSEGLLLMEIGCGQAEEVKSMFASGGAFCGVEIYKDYCGIDRIVKAKKDGQISHRRRQAP
ncbi:MAG: peptide chain release factor N(5)-glutamine methyltransferase [Candidatus Omnitrophica bacterium]|nr:peptide chain release factor N(5)-glutamine methyltransferase [Candidatus Omnitrophota bacterium]